MTTNTNFLRHLHLPVLVFVGIGAALLGWVYGLHVGLLVLGYYYIGLHVSDLRQCSISAEAVATKAVDVSDATQPGPFEEVNVTQESGQSASERLRCKDAEEATK